MDAAKDGPFLSKDDFRHAHQGCPRPSWISWSDLGILLGDLPESNQLSACLILRYREKRYKTNKITDVMRQQKAACMTGRQTERTQGALSVLYFGFES